MPASSPAGCAEKNIGGNKVRIRIASGSLFSEHWHTDLEVHVLLAGQHVGFFLKVVHTDVGLVEKGGNEKRKS